MKKLIIKAHPSSQGFTHKIAESYSDGAKDAHCDVEIIDLYDEDFHQDYLKFEDKKIFGEDKNRLKIQNKINEASELVFIFPVWWGDAPAIMKNFLDTNFTSGFAFKYTKKGPEGLLSGKKAKVIATCDAPGFLYKFFLLPLNLGGLWGTYRLKFCGIKKTQFILFDRMNKRDELNRKKILDKVFLLGKKD